MNGTTLQNILDIFDYNFEHEIFTKVNGKCYSTLCNKSKCFRTITIPLVRYTWIENEKKKFNTKIDFFKEMCLNKGYLTACIDRPDDGSHLCDAFLVMIGTKLYKKILNIVSNILFSVNNTVTLYVDSEVENKLTGTFISNGIIYFSSFRDFNNNKFCHHNEILNRMTIYLYDDTSQGYMLSSDCKDNKVMNLMYKDKNGKITYLKNENGEICNNSNNILKRLYDLCGCFIEEDFYDYSTTILLDFIYQVYLYRVDIDNIKNKLFLSYAQAVYQLFEKIDIFENKHIWNKAVLNGNVVTVFSQNLIFDNSKSQINKEIIKNLKCNNDKLKILNNKVNNKPQTNIKKNTLLLRKILSANNNTNTSYFTHLEAFHLDKVQLLMENVQRIRPHNVRSLKAKLLTSDSIGFLCPFGLGNIGSAGKNINLVEGVVVSYGRLKNTIKQLISEIKKCCYNINHGKGNSIRIVINNIPTKFELPRDANRLEFFHKMKSIWQYFEILFFNDKFCCVNMYNGVLMKKVDSLYLSRREMEWYLSHNMLYLHDNKIHMSRLARECSSYMRYTPPGKISVGVNAYKSSLPNDSYSRMGLLLNRSNQIYVNGNKNSNKYNMLLAFGEIDGYNEGDGYVIRNDYDFNLLIQDNFEFFIRSKEEIKINLFQRDKIGIAINKNERNEIIDVMLCFGTIITKDENAFIVDYHKVLYKTKYANHYVYYIYVHKNDENFINFIRQNRDIKHLKLEREIYKYLQIYDKKNKDWIVEGESNVHKFSTKNFNIYNVCVIKIHYNYRSPFYTGLKLVNNYGQKGLCIKRHELDSLICVNNNDPLDIRPLDIVANIFSFIGRSALGQYQEMKTNGLYRVYDKTDGTYLGTAGLCSMWINNNDPNRILSEKSIRHDSLSKPCLLVNNIPLTMNVQLSSNDIHNPTGECIPPHAKYIFKLYDCFSIHYKFYNSMSEDSEVKYLNDRMLKNEDFKYIKTMYEKIKKKMKLNQPKRKTKKSKFKI